LYENKGAKAARAVGVSSFSGFRNFPEQRKMFQHGFQQKNIRLQMGIAPFFTL